METFFLFRSFIPCSFTHRFHLSDSSVSSVQVTQQVFVAEKWAKNSQAEVNAEVQSRLASEKAAGVLQLEKERLNEKIKEVTKARDSAEASLEITTR